MISAIDPQTRADMFKRGYVYARKADGVNGVRRIVSIPYFHEDHELIFDTDAYERTNNMNRDFDTRPRQAGGRTQSDYGRTTLYSQREDSGGFLRTTIAVTAFMMLLLWLGGYAGGVV